MNVSGRNIKGICDYKCAFSFDYPTINPIVTNKMIYLSLSSDYSSIPPVMFNGQPYLVSQIQIYSPSLHLYNGEKMPAELVILHSPQNGGTNLNVCIPININDSSTSIINKVISFSIKNVPTTDDSMTLNISNFSLNDIVPKSPFYNYKGKDINNDYDVNYIVYGKDAALYITTENSTNLSNILTEVELNTSSDGSLFFNKKGPVSSEENGEIYISCENTNTSKEMEQVTTTTNNNTTTFNWSEAFKNPIWITIFSIIGALFLCLFVYYLLNYVYLKLAQSPSSQSGGNGFKIRKKVTFNI